MRSFVDEASKRQLSEAVRSIERLSEVEVVVAIRKRSSDVLAACLAAGIVVGWLVLAFLMYSPWPFAHLAFLVEPLLFGLLAGFLVSRSPVALRALIPRSSRRRQVATAAHALFHEKEVGLTHRRTGALIFISLLEREVMVIADRAITDGVDSDDWRRHLDVLSVAVKRARSGAELAAAVSALSGPLAAALPRLQDDTNELPDEVDFGDLS